MKRYVVAAVVVGAAWVLSAPSDIHPRDFAGLTGDPQAGEQVFWATGCASCHAVDDANPLTLAGGQAFASDFGTFYAPNISPDPVQGIGGWSLAEFARAVQQGVGKDGAHLYPALPYNAYNKLVAQDVADLKAYMDALPPRIRPTNRMMWGFPLTSAAHWVCGS